LEGKFKKGLATKGNGRGKVLEKISLEKRRESGCSKVKPTTRTEEKGLVGSRRKRVHVIPSIQKEGRISQVKG